MNSNELRTDVPYGCLNVGDETAFGKIERVSLTAYEIGGVWYPYFKVHGPVVPVTPLVLFWD